MADPAIVSGVRLDKYLVTVGRFRKLIAAWDGGAGYQPAEGSGKHTHLNGGKGLVDAASIAAGTAVTYEPGWITKDNKNLTLSSDSLACDPDYATWSADVGEHENLPINCVNWYEAYAFCIWDGGFLPSEAELAYASAGGSEQRAYPWGGNSPGTDNQYAIYGCNYGASADGCSGIANIAPVGTATKGAGRWGHVDLAGDMSEWLLDVYAPFATPCTDCASFAGGSGRVNRGGSFRSSTTMYLQSSFRGDLLYGINRTAQYGIRCARTP